MTRNLPGNSRIKMLIALMGLSTFSFSAVPTKADLDSAIAMRTGFIDTNKKGTELLQAFKKTTITPSMTFGIEVANTNIVYEIFTDLFVLQDIEIQLLKIEMSGDSGKSVATLRIAVEKKIVNRADRLGSLATLFHDSQVGVVSTSKAYLEEVIQRCKGLSTRVASLVRSDGKADQPIWETAPAGRGRSGAVSGPP